MLINRHGRVDLILVDEASRTPLSPERWLGVSDWPVDEEGQAVTDGADVGEDPHTQI